MASATAWTPAQATLRVPAGASAVYIDVAGEAPMGTCLLVDDARLTYAP